MTLVSDSRGLRDHEPTQHISCQHLLSRFLSTTVVKDSHQRLLSTTHVNDSRGTRDDEPTGHDKT